VHLGHFFHDIQVSIVGATINGINKRLDQVSSHPLYFNFNFRPHYFSIRGCNMENRAYVGDSSSGPVYDPIYAGKVSHAHIYIALYTIVTKLARVQVREQHF